MYGVIKNIASQSVATTSAIVKKVQEGDAAGAETRLWSQAKGHYVQWLAAIEARPLLKACNIRPAA